MNITIKPTDDLDHKMEESLRNWFQMSHLNGLIIWKSRSKKRLIGNLRVTGSHKSARRWLMKAFKRSKNCSIPKFNPRFSSWAKFQSSRWCNSVWRQAQPVWASIRHQQQPETVAMAKATPTAEKWWTITTSTVTQRSRWVYLHPTKLKAKETTRSQTNSNAVIQLEHRSKVNSLSRSNSKALENLVHLKNSDIDNDKLKQVLRNFDVH